MLSSTTRNIFLTAILLVLCSVASAQKKIPPSTPRATVVHEAIVYLAADSNSGRVSTVLPGHEVALLEHNGPWVRAFANTDIQESSEDQPEFGEPENVTPVSGWIRDRGIVSAQTPNGDAILFGAAADAEADATAPHPAPHSADDARLLYRRVWQYFPQSPLSAEAAWRSADIRWQMEKADSLSRPSAHEREAYLREQMNESEMKKIIRNYPNSKWADYAAFEMIDNKLCGDWQGQAKCPEKESSLYEKFADGHPGGPRTAQALYEAAYRQAVLVDMYLADDEQKKADGAQAKATGLAQKLASTFPGSEYAPRAAALIYKLQQHVAVFGEEHD